MNGYREIVRCRLCGNPNLESLLDLGAQALTGVFPRTADEEVPLAPLHLVKCSEEEGNKTCGLAQLKHSYEPECLYGVNYGYRSGLNASMVAHLQEKARKIKARVALRAGDMVLDIGSNDGTLLRAMEEPGADRVGIDPTGEKFREYYPPQVRLIPDFFSSALFRNEFGVRKAKVVTSIAMFYDLESPLDFMRQVAEVLTEDGIWVFEQSYLPVMLGMTLYDTICHEHLEYYCLKQIKFMTDRAGLKIVDIELNDINGGSFSLTVAKETSGIPEDRACITRMLEEEERSGLRGREIYHRFRERVFRHREELRKLIETMLQNGERLFGYGASTKGNVILQFCGLSAKEVPFVAEVNEDKFGCFTPQTKIPIISEAQARAMQPDAFLVLPWHFRKHILQREQGYLKTGGKLIFPLPAVEVVTNAESPHRRL